MFFSKSRFTSTLVVPDVGEVVFRRNPRAKRLTISIRPRTGVRVTIPGFLPYSVAQQFVDEKKFWITEKLKELSLFKSDKIIENGFKTRNYELQFCAHKQNTIKYRPNNQFIQILHPESMCYTDEGVQKVAKEAIDMAYRLEAKDILPKRVGELAQQYGFSYNSVKVRKTYSRWGSCSAKNNISLSIYLMKLPDELIDYIILHELTHTIHKNHGPNFWNHLNKITGNAKAYANRVKKYRTGL